MFLLMFVCPQGAGLPSHNAMEQADHRKKTDPLRRQTPSEFRSPSEGRNAPSRYGQPAGGTHPTLMDPC